MATNVMSGPGFHNFGIPVEGDLTVAEALKLAGADFEVFKTPDETTFFGQKVVNPKRSNLTRFHPDFPDDPSKGIILGNVGRVYHLMQNREGGEFAKFIVDDSDAKVDTVGPIGQGEQIFLTLKLPDGVRIESEGIKDGMDVYVLVSWGHDGKTQLTAAVILDRPFCSNVINFAIKNATNKIMIKHTGKMEERMRGARAALKVTFEYTEAWQELAEFLVNESLNEDRFRIVTRTLWPDEGTKAAREHNDLNRSTAMYIFKHNDTLLGNMTGHRTKWDGLNALTYQFDHERDFKSLNNGLSGNAARDYSTVFSPASEIWKAKALKVLEAV